MWVATRLLIDILGSIKSFYRGGQTDMNSLLNFLIRLTFCAMIIMTIGLGCSNKSNTPSTGSAIKPFEHDAHTIALWHYNEGAGQSIADNSGNGYTLVLGSDTTIEEADPTWSTSGILGGFLLFDSSKAEYVWANSTLTFPANQLSVEFWYKTNAQTGYMFSSNGLSIAACWDGARQLRFAVGNGSNWTELSIGDAAVNDFIANGEWHYLAFTYSGSQLKVYVDGLAKDSLLQTTTITDAVGVFVGGRPFNTFVNDSLDEMRISDIARTPSEIQTYYHK
jgi:hypothetical protein